MSANKHGRKQVRGTQAGKREKQEKIPFTRRKISEQFGLDSGILCKIENRLGHNYSWFRQNEKKNWITRKKFDPDGFDKFGNDLTYLITFKRWKRKGT